MTATFPRLRARSTPHQHRRKRAHWRIGISSPSNPTQSTEQPDRSFAPIAVALDAPDISTLTSWAASVAPHVRCLKVGLEAFCRDGHRSVLAARDAARDADHPHISIFLDLKLHDIPATVAGAARAVAPLAPTYLTVHASGGPQMVRAAVEALPDTRVTAVTLLTSLDQASARELGISGSPSDIVARWAATAVDAGARALVCSPHEVTRLRSIVPSEVHLITPGIRPVGASAHDQRRASTPAQALADGSDLLVIGRPITGEPDPRAAAIAIAEECRT
ncbi:MAG: orotidine-5'-phosphate decarboxylase [Actinobacteria bacterium]|nr:orotidine-5'-phosphate decarboxylase [Actinomycetota bacterium]NDA48893.1 orotidine-5'-phosphate decarboxylase [Actinomycetota bacterium]NDA58393.1 orotidine-5'-phosphate decarboxylase [Actinomycetota bacterium]NDG94328.1 orotidine-5'-phosphate decarboxylase [Actinomycetota bacterium]NDH13497.1 orotidine-5'-phosphate decarboxylase [Actinomycetota bacterium]